LSGSSSCESNEEDSKNISIGSLGINVDFNESLPLADHLAKFISGDIKSVERGFTVTALNIINDKLDLTPSKLFRLTLEISEGRFNNTSLDDFSCDF
jgi:hypothetical protein